MALLLISCVDGRLRDALDHLEASLGSHGCDRLLVPGGPLALADAGPQRESVIAWVELLATWKGSKDVCLASHQQCLAYQRRAGGFFHDEREVVERDLRAAKALLQDRVYGLHVACYIVPWQDDAEGGRFLVAEKVE